MVDTEVRPVGEQPPALRTVSGLVSRPELGEAGHAEAVSARCGDGVAEDVSAQGAQEVLLVEIHRRRHT